MCDAPGGHCIALTRCNSWVRVASCGLARSGTALRSNCGNFWNITALDLSQYVLIEKGGVRGDVSMHLKFDTAELAFRWILRNDGQPLWNAPLTPASNSANTLSPFVALAAR